MSLVEKTGEGVFFYEDLHDGVGKILVQRYFEGAHPWPVDIEIWELPVGATEGSHSHDDSEPEYGSMSELYLVIEGTARMHIGGEKVELGVGDAALAAPGVEHDLVNTGERPLRVLVISEPAKSDN